MSRIITVCDEVREILAQCSIENNVLKIPDSIGVLPRPTYAKLAKVVEAAGGKWNRKAGGMVFERDPSETLGMAMRAGAIQPPQITDVKKTLNQFFTPQALAWEVALHLGDISDARVLEPSAGKGALANAAREYGAIVDCIEIDEHHAKDLKGQGHNVFCMDFLDFKPVHPPYDAVLMNPPFSEGRDIAHVRHAFEHCLKRGGVLVAITAPGWTFRDDRKHREFREWFEEVGGETLKELEAGAFRESGTDVRTLVLRIQK